MEDRFKIRFYDTRLEKMIYPCDMSMEDWEELEELEKKATGKYSHFVLDEHYPVHLPMGIKMFWEFIKKSGFPVMQCTGMRDKNGVLIWEGDIGRRTLGKGFADQPDWWDYWKIIFYFGTYVTHKFLTERPDNPYFGFGRGKKIYEEKIPNTYSRRFNEIEIIGNIHQNKDLI